MEKNIVRYSISMKWRMVNVFLFEKEINEKRKDKKKDKKVKMLKVERQGWLGSCQAWKISMEGSKVETNRDWDWHLIDVWYRMWKKNQQKKWHQDVNAPSCKSGDAGVSMIFLTKIFVTILGFDYCTFIRKFLESLPSGSYDIPLLPPYAPPGPPPSC